MAKQENMMGQEPTKKQLMDYVSQLQNQNQQLIQRVQELNNFAMFKRCDYLFEVIKNANVFPEDFVRKCVEEITVFLTIPERPEQPEQPEAPAEEEKKEE